MRLSHSLLTAAATFGIASIATAQQNQPAPKKAEPRGERCVSTDGRVECSLLRRADLDSVLMKRAALGIQLGSTGSIRDTIGVFVTRVTPKGPAENAGIVEGERIVSINGVDLRVNPADAGDSYASGLPARRLAREVQKLAPGAAVNLRVWSGGRVRDVRVTAGRASDLRDRGSFGYIFDGIGGATGFSEIPRIRIESMPRIQLENIPQMRPRVRVLSSPDRLRQIDI